MAELLARDAELALISDALGDACAGRGALVVVRAPAGNGRSSLLAAAGRLADERRMRVLAARGAELERDLPHGVVRQLFERALADATDQERAAWLSGAAEAAGRLVQPTTGGAGGPAAGPEMGPRHAVYWLASNMAADRPLLLLIDDLHDADDDSLRILAYLAHRLADLPVAVVCALRHHEARAQADALDPVEAICGEPSSRQITLGPLPASAVATLVREAVPGADDADCAACLAATGGNPFYLRELLRAAGGNGDHASLADAVTDATLTSVADRVLRRLHRVGPGAAALARAMAVLGDGGRLAHAAAVAGLREAEAARTAAHMRRIQILAAEDPFAFTHPLVRRSIHDELTVTERDAAHLAAADILEAAGAPVELVAAHLDRLRPAGRDRVAATLRAAAGAAIGRDAPEAAIAMLRRALGEDAPAPGRGALLRELGLLELAQRDPAAVEHLQEAHGLVTDPAERAGIAGALTEILITMGRWDEGLGMIAAALAELGDDRPEAALELEVLRAATISFDPRAVAEFERDRDRLAVLAERDTWAGRALSTVLAASLAMRGGPPGDLMRLCDRVLADDVLFAERGAGSWASSYLLGALVQAEAGDRLREAADRVEAHARAQGSLFGVTIAQGYRGYMLARTGDLTRAEEIMRPLLEVTQANGMPLLVVTGLFMLRDPLLEMPSLADLAGLVEAMPLDPDFARTATGAMLGLLRGELRASRGERDAGVADLRAAGAAFSALGFGPGYAPWRSSLALALAPEDREEARELAREELAIAETSPLPRPRGVALRTAGLLADGDDAPDLLSRSVEVLGGSPARLEHARSLVELGAALRRRGRRADAREPLRAGAELALACGAERLLERAREELRVSGGRPVRVARPGLAALTASERRVARLAAAGRTNPEIAQELFVSVKTVETHLLNAYAKLGLSGRGSRARLRALIAEGAEPS